MSRLLVKNSGRSHEQIRTSGPGGIHLNGTLVSQVYDCKSPVIVSPTDVVTTNGDETAAADDAANVWYFAGSQNYMYCNSIGAAAQWWPEPSAAGLDIAILILS